MAARIVAVSPDEPRDGRLEEAAEVLRRGGVVALPTETFYGLAVDAFQPAALTRLNRIKRKADNSPILLLLSGPEQLGQVAASGSPALDALSHRFWPGPLTLVVAAAKGVPPEISGGRGTVGVRVPGMLLPRRLAQLLGRPITGVSANLHREAPCRTAEEVVRTFDDQVDMVLDGGEAPGGAPSTIIDLTGPRPIVLRPGLVPLSALKPFLEGL